MTDEIIPLNAPDRSPVKPRAVEINLGQRYDLAVPLKQSDIHGLCDGTRFELHSGDVCPVKVGARQAVVWDIGSDLDDEEIVIINGDEHVTLSSDTSAAGSQFIISNATLNKPQVLSDDPHTRLVMDVEFEMLYSSPTIDTQLGVINLLQAERFAILSDGGTRMLFENASSHKVLYVPDRQKAVAVQELVTVAKGTKNRHDTYRESICHQIPAQYEGVEVDTVTVLEQYETYFVQRELPHHKDNYWIPVCPPVRWGWSIRVSRREDGERVITRQKLLNPVIGHNGLEMPSWQGNSLNVS